MQGVCPEWPGEGLPPRKSENVSFVFLLAGHSLRPEWTRSVLYSVLRDHSGTYHNCSLTDRHGELWTPETWMPAGSGGACCSVVTETSSVVCANSFASSAFTLSSKFSESAIESDD